MHTSLTINPVTPAIGAVLDGIDLSQPLDRATTVAFAEAVHEYQVVFVRGQSLTSEQFAAFAHQFGAHGTHPVNELLGRDRPTSIIEDTAERPPAGFDWHTDLSWTPAPPNWGFLRAIDIPAVGGDTLWASGRAMYERLEPALRSWCESLSLLHAPDPSLIATMRRHHGDALGDEIERRFGVIAQPLVRAHPVTDRPALWLCPLSTVGVANMDEDDIAHALLDLLDRQIDEPDVQVRWKWQTGDIAVWDETSTVHRALADHAPQHRMMERCTAAGVAPVPYRSAVARGAAA